MENIPRFVIRGIEVEKNFKKCSYSDVQDNEIVNLVSPKPIELHIEEVLEILQEWDNNKVVNEPQEVTISF